MKKFERKKPELDLIKLFANDARLLGLTQYTEADFEAFGERATAAAATAIEQQHRTRGIRAEYIFESVVVGLGHVRLIKAEDSSAYYAGEDIELPDFRLVLEDGQQWLVEVKTHRASPAEDLRFSDAYIQRLLRYSKLVNTSLRFAVFWEYVGLWTLTSLDAFEPGVHAQKRWTLSFENAVMENEMISIGDWFIMTPAPIVFRITFTGEGRSETTPEGTRHLVTVKDAQILSHDTPLSGVSARIATTLAWYGGWPEGTPRVTDKNGVPKAIEYWFQPNEDDAPGEQQLMGPVSAMISRAFLDESGEKLRPSRDIEVLRPGYMGKEFVPEDWLGMDLELSISKFFVRPRTCGKDGDSQPTRSE